MSHRHGPWPGVMPPGPHPGQSSSFCPPLPMPLPVPLHPAAGDTQTRAGAKAYGNNSVAPSSPQTAEDDEESFPVCQESRIRHRPPMMVDWRREICRFLEIGTDSDDDDILQKIDEASDLLKEAERLKLLAISQQGPPKFQVINRIQCRQSQTEMGLYLDTPWVVESGRHQAHLRCSKAIHNLELFMERNKEITFIVYRNFECCGSTPPIPNPSVSEKTHGVDPSSLLLTEYVSIVSDELRLALVELAALTLQRIPHPNFESDESQFIPLPYLWWFHRRDKIELAKPSLDPTSQQHIEVFQSYLEDRLGEEWAAVDALLGRGKITAEYLDYLFVPGEIVISRMKGNSIAQWEASTATHWLVTQPSRPGPGQDAQINATINAVHWRFDGNFQQHPTILTVGPIPSMTDEFAIDELLTFPKKFAGEQVVSAIRERGKMFWRCRRQNYVSFTGSAEDGMYNAYADSRFMIDIATYKQMHPPAQGQPDVRPYRDELGPEQMAQDLPDLTDEFYMCLPTSIYGFNMQKKEWINLEVGFIEEVVWNKEAFDLLVVDPGTKELVEAVVTNHVYVEEHTDVIRGKGNGLFILLHGGPGTGKTLTAESVAEIAKKPLYRVTCGDIGTKAEEVEKYLEVVLLLGRTWGCVVLLDEADVFLEQRTLHDLDRNALVSVFLRVLEYYDGILILTSNRVGIFDEAFKSRIQLNLRYENLNQVQRRKIWENFINRLEKLELERQKSIEARSPRAPFLGTPQPSASFGVDIDSMREKLDDLAAPPLNGREIRNVISTARQLARFRKQKLGYEHLDAVIGEANKFESYIKDLKLGFSADQINRQQRVR